MSAKPATPLPWLIEHDDRGTAFVRGSDMRPGNAVYNSRRTAGKLNAAYIVHAANAYPELVAALRKALNQLDALNGSEGEFSAIAKLPDVRTTEAYKANRALLARLEGDK